MATTPCGLRRPLTIKPWSSLADSCGFAAMRYAWNDGDALRGRTSPRRRAEFRAGRRCAVEAIRLITGQGLMPRRVKADRAPLWPEHVAGAISHCDGYAVAVAARHTRWSCLGIDVERLLGAEEADMIAPHIFTDAEQLAFARRGDAAFLTTLAFSAKESLFKALYPVVREFKDFHAAQLVPPESGDGLRLRLCTDWSARWRTGDMIDVRVRQIGRFVLTCIAIPPERAR